MIWNRNFGWSKGSRALGAVGLTLAVGMAVMPARVAQGQAKDNNDAKIEGEVRKALDSKKLNSVSASVQGGNVVLTGTVPLYEDKEMADNRVHHVKGIKGVQNEIEVAGPTVDDATLRDKLAKALAYDRVGYGTTSFNSITIGVQNGVVTLGGTVYWPPDKDSALGLVANTPGVKDIVDEIQVAPVSPMDDRLRIQLWRTIYGDPALQKYAIDPAKPIRITVINGKVTLSGVVDSKMDRDIAGIRANSVPGVFQVTNDIQVASDQPKK